MVTQGQVKSSSGNGHPAIDMATEFGNMYRALGALTQAIGQQQTQAGDQRASKASYAIKQFKEMKPPTFKGTTDPLEVEA